MEFEINKKCYLLRSASDIRELSTGSPFDKEVTAGALEFCAHAEVFSSLSAEELESLVNWLSGYSKKPPEYVNDSVLKKVRKLLNVLIPEVRRNARLLEVVLRTLTEAEYTATYAAGKVFKSSSPCRRLFPTEESILVAYCGSPPKGLVDALAAYKSGWASLIKEVRASIGKRKHKLSVLYARFGKTLYRAYAAYPVTDKGTSTKKRCAQCAHAIKRMDEDPCCGCAGTGKVNWTPKPSEVKSDKDGGPDDRFI